MYSLALCHLDFFSNPPRWAEVHSIANEQGGIIGELTGGTDKSSNSAANNALFGVGGWRNGRAGAAIQMRIAFVLTHACW